jgi:hypothetical protein
MLFRTHHTLWRVRVSLHLLLCQHRQLCHYLHLCPAFVNQGEKIWRGLSGCARAHTADPTSLPLPVLLYAYPYIINKLEEHHDKHAAYVIWPWHTLTAVPTGKYLAHLGSSPSSCIVMALNLRALTMCIMVCSGTCSAVLAMWYVYDNSSITFDIFNAWRLRRPAGGWSSRSSALGAFFSRHFRTTSGPDLSLWEKCILKLLFKCLRASSGYSLYHSELEY